MTKIKVLNEPIEKFKLNILLLHNHTQYAVLQCQNKMKCFCRSSGWRSGQQIRMQACHNPWLSHICIREITFKCYSLQQTLKTPLFFVGPLEIWFSTASLTKDIPRKNRVSQKKCSFARWAKLGFFRILNLSPKIL